MIESAGSFEELTGAHPTLYVMEKFLGGEAISEADLKATYAWVVEQAKLICTEDEVITTRGSLNYATKVSPSRTYTARNGRTAEVKLLLSRGKRSLHEDDEVEKVELAVIEHGQLCPLLELTDECCGSFLKGWDNPADLDVMVKAIELFQTPEVPREDVIKPVAEVEPSTSFTNYMRNLMYQLKAKTVVEIGPDSQYLDAMQLSRNCQKYIAVSLPSFVEYSKVCYELGQEMGRLDIELIPGNATELSSLVDKADLVFVKNAALELYDGDMTRIWQDKRGEIKLSEDERNQLFDRLREAERKSLNEALIVARNGCLVTFYRTPQSNDKYALLTQELGVDPARITRQPLRYDYDGIANDDEWELLMIDNRKVSSS
jgi:hypothetical protein